MTDIGGPDESHRTDGVWRRREPQSPCVKVCVMHAESELCIGCLRTIDEIVSWARMPAAARAEVLAELPYRSVQPGGRRGGRAARLNRRDAAE